MRGIAVTGQPDIDQATAEIAVVLRDAGYGKREQDCYDEASRLRDAIMAGTRALDAAEPSLTDGFTAHELDALVTSAVELWEQADDDVDLNEGQQAVLSKARTAVYEDWGVTP